MNDDVAVTADLAEWREKILQRTLWTTAVLAGIAYVPGVIAAYSQQLWLLITLDTVLWGLVVGLALWRSLPFRIRAGVFVGLWLIFSLALLWITGPVGAGVAWLLAVPILAALFFGNTGALVGSGLMGVVAIGFGLLLPVHQRGGMLVAGPPYDAISWTASAGSLVFIAALLGLSIARLLKGLENSLADLAASKRRLETALDERERLQDELLRAHKQSALGTLASGVAHDFNNLLVPIMMGSEEARDQARPGSPQRKHLDAVLQAALRARDLVRRILTFSRGADADRRPIAVEPVLREVGALLRSTAPAGIRFEFRIEAPDAQILGDPGELNQILMNLGTNAYLAMRPDGGTLTLGLAREPGGIVRIDVCDTGVGIPPELQARIFDPFFTTREPGRGTGLGLAIVDRLVRAMDGTVQVVSTPGTGTCFNLRFAEVAAGERSERSMPATDTMDGESGAATPVLARIMVVDDEDTVRTTLAMILTRIGYRVLEAATPESALRQIHDDPGCTDLLFTDQAMPGMTGLALAEQVRRLHPDLPIVLASGHLEPQDLDQVRALALDGVLEKPFSRSQVRELLERILKEPPQHSGTRGGQPENLP